MGYRPTSIRVRQAGRRSFYAYVVYEDDGLPDEECPVHGWDPPREGIGTLMIDGVPWHKAPRGAAADCCCSVQTGAPLEEGPYHAFTHKRAWRKARRAMKREEQYR